MKTAFFSLVIFCVLSSCAPSAQHIEFDKGRTSFGPSKQDTNVMGATTVNNMDVTWADSISGSSFDRWLENLTELSIENQDAELKQKSKDLYFQVQKLKVQKSLPYGESAYPQMIILESKPFAVSEINQALQIVDGNLNLLKSVISRAPAPAANTNMQLAEFAILAQNYLQNLVLNLQQMDLYPAVKAALTARLNEQSLRLDQLAGKNIPLLEQSKTISQLLSVVSSVLTSEKINVSSETQNSLNEGISLGHMLDSMSSAQDAFSIIIEVWKQLTPARREEIFKPLNESLYNFLDGRKEKSLNCLQNTNCRNLLSQIERGLFILPAIEKYGLENLRTQINQQAVEFAMGDIKANLAEQLRTIPQLIVQTIDEEFTKQIRDVTQVRDHFENEVQSRMQTLVAGLLPGSQGKINSIQAYSLKTQMIKGQIFAKSSFANLNPEDVAADLGSSSHWLLESDFKSEADKKLALEKLDLVSDIYLKQKNFSLQKFAQLPIRGQAEWIRGLSRWDRVFQDWQPSAFNTAFDSVKASSLFPEYEAEALNRGLFPKEAFFALGLSAVGEGLRTVTQAPSPFFLVDVQNQIMWVDQYNFDKSETQAVMVGVVDQSHGIKSSYVHAEDLARYILAICEFLQTIENIEKTNSDLLLSPRAGSSLAPILELQQNKSNLKLLLLGLANYLSHQMRDQDGLIQAALDVNTGKPVDLPKSLLDQALTLRSLVAASKTLKIELYQWEAQDLLFSMNKNMFKKELQFYSQTTQVSALPNALIMTEMLRALAELGPYLPPESQAQAKWISLGWTEKLKKVDIQFSF